MMNVIITVIVILLMFFTLCWFVKGFRFGTGWVWGWYKVGLSVGRSIKGHLSYSQQTRILGPSELELVLWSGECSY